MPNDVIVHYQSTPGFMVQIANAQIYQGAASSVIHLPIDKARELWNELGNKLNDYEKMLEDASGDSSE